MCGIVGTWRAQEQFDPRIFKKMVNTLTSRGPDGLGIKILSNGEVLLGHRRLSINDLSKAGSQPMCNEDKTIWLTFNGEIYNCHVLRKRLEKEGHIFSSKSDSEVIIHAYEKWGNACVSRLKGIFAFGIWDERKKKLFLARDHLGVKPLYYAYDNLKRFTFASQPKAIVEDQCFRRKIDHEALRDYFAFGYVPWDKCIFQGIKKLPPAHTLTLTENGICLERYWHISYKPTINSIQEAVDCIDEKIREAVALQMLGDVPIGTLLSGGIDSSLVTAIASPVSEAANNRMKSFTIGFHEAGSDERGFAQIAADCFHTEHHEGVFKQAMLLRQLDKMIEAFDEPFDPNGPMPMMLISELVRNRKTKVVLGGDGADELFAGYLRYDQYCDFVNGKNAFLVRLLRNIKQNNFTDADHYFRYEGACDNLWLKKIFLKNRDDEFYLGYKDIYRKFFNPELPPVAAAQLMDLNTYLPDHILCKIDRASMAFGIETRVPFLDVNLVEAAFSLESNINYFKQERKALLKKVAAKYMPDNLITKRKKGFSSPLKQWSNQDFFDWAVPIISNGFLVSEGIISLQAVLMIKNLKNNKGLRIIWLVLTAELWSKRWIFDMPKA